ncbi:hypothetical protein [Enhygromyxa salina]|nr:hypothetical protein [Enhygromyxa salina]
MPYQVSRTDTGQFVLMDPSTDTVIIDDDLSAGFDKLDSTVANKPVKATPPGPEGSGADPTTQGSSAFSFEGGPRYTPVLLAVVLPFAWLAVLYFALANLLSEHALDRGAAKETQTKIEELERELQSLRSEIAGAPRTAKKPPKSKPKSKPKPKPKPKPTPVKTVGTARGPETAGEQANDPSKDPANNKGAR